MTLAWADVILPLSFATGGGLGAVARYLLAKSLPHKYPFATLLVNVLGCFLLGLVLALVWAAPGFLPGEARQIFAGFCGGFTTFSSFAYQSLDLHREHSLRHAALNIGASIVLCVASFLAGRFLGQLVVFVDR